MTVALREPWTIERFLAWEDRQEGRHEFDGLQISEVTGKSRDHQRIISNLIRLLEDALDPARIRYPEVSVAAGRTPGTVRTLCDTLVLFENLSQDSAARDRGDKRAEYAGLTSIRRYVILEQTKPAATLRFAGAWDRRAALRRVPGRSLRLKNRRSSRDDTTNIPFRGCL